jgi:uncharacterized membrane protein (UPF0127 family)
VVVALGGAALLAVWWIRGDHGPDTATLSVVSGDDEFEGCLLLADSPGEREQGLMHVTDLEGHDGMVFEFEAERPRAFWMKNTPMPLSIAFYDGDGAFVSSADMEPCGDSDACPSTFSGGAAKYAVEVPQGGLPSLGLVEGSHIDVGGACDP